MAEYKLILQPRSPFHSQLQSDTIFGHICWALRYTKGEKELLSFLKSFKENVCPFLISSGFPLGFLPLPILRPLSNEEEEALLVQFYGSDKSSRLEFAQHLKELRKKIRYVPLSIMSQIEKNLSYYELYGNYSPDKLDDPTLFPQISSMEATWHNAKNRLTDMVIKGRLYAKEDFFFKEGSSLVVYIKDSYFDRKTLIDVFTFISLSGYGADKSSGRGLFDYELQDGWDLPEAANPTGFITLSLYYPVAGDFKKGFYEIMTKFGKLGGHWAAAGAGNPFKLPLLMLAPGSYFEVEDKKPFYGGLIHKVHTRNPEIVHYGLALPLKVRSV